MFLFPQSQFKLHFLNMVCCFTVTTTSQARTALAMLRENKYRFDLVISDVHMPDMDGFKLLELVGLEMDLPVISINTLIILIVYLSLRFCSLGCR